MIKVGLAFLLITLLVLTGGPAQAQVPSEILIGGTISKSGPFAAEVAPFDELAHNWAKIINEREGGIFLKEYGKKLPVRFIIYDDKTDAETSVKMYERLATVDKVHLFIGPYSSPLTIRASTVAEKYKIPMVTIEANADKIFQRGFKYIFGVIDSGTLWSIHYFDMLKREGKIKTMALIIDDRPHTMDVGVGARRDAEKVGLKIVFDQVFPAKTTDFTATITKLKALDPDLVYVSSFPDFAIVFMKQAKELGLNPREFHIIHAVKATTAALGKDAMYITGEHFWAEGMKFGNVALYKEILDKTGIKHFDYPWSAIRMMGYDAIKAALEKAGTLDKERLREALATLRYETLCGTNWFKPNGQGHCNTVSQQFLGDRWYPIAPPEVAVPGKRVFPTPPWDKRP